MDKDRRFRIGIFTAAMAMAAVLLILLSRHPQPERPAPSPIGIDPATIPTIDRVLDSRQISPDALAAGQYAVVQRTDPQTGRLTQQFISRSLTPGEGGVFDVGQPEALIYIEPWQVVRLRSDRGRFVMPADLPQSGEFNDHVVITVYQAARGSTVQLGPDSPDIIAEIRLDRAEFDATLGEVRSESPLTVTANRPDGRMVFEGQGLILQFNQIDQRIEYLEVRHGRSLQYIPSAISVAAQPAAEPAPQTPPTPAPADLEPRPDSQPTTWYRLTFHDNVIVTRAERSVAGEHLTAFFSLDRQLSPPDTTADATNDPTPRLLALADPSSLILAQVDTAAAAPQPDPDDQLTPTTIPLTDTEDRRPVTMTWTGRMVMEPTSTPPTQLTGPDDLLLEVTGRPVELALGPDDRLHCDTLTYHATESTAVAAGSAVTPLRIVSPKLGEVRGETLTMRLDDDLIRLDGPGTIRAPDAPALAATPTPATPTPDPATSPPIAEPAAAAGLPSGMRVRWNQAVELRLASASASNSAASPIASGTGDIESVAFLGSVSVTDPRFEMTGNMLRVGFANLDSAGQPLDSPQVSGIDAEGDVRITTADGSLEAGSLIVTAEPDPSGRFTPKRIIGSGGVRLIDPTQRLESADLDIELDTSEPDGDAGEEPARAAGRLESAFDASVRRLTAGRDVRLTLSDGTTIAGDRLEADASLRAALLTGSPLRITRADRDQQAPSAAPDQTASVSELETLNLRIEQDGRLVFSDGPGLFRFREAAPPPIQRPERDDQAPAPTPAAPPRRLAVAWLDSMNYNDADQILTVAGNVEAGIDENAQTLNQLRASRLALEIIDLDRLRRETSPATAGDNSALPAAPTLSTGASLDRMGGERQLQRLTAEGDVVILGTRWADAARATLETRLQIKGPRLTFRALDELVRVEGAGSLLAEDHRPSAAEPAPAPAPSAPSRNATSPTASPAAPAPPRSAVSRLSGRGATLFTWQNALELSGSANTLAMIGNVRMTHEAADRSVIELWADRLDASLRPSAGALEPINLTQRGSIDVQTIHAAGNVQIRSGAREVSADDLRFDGPTQTVTLTARTGRWVEVVDRNQPRPLRGAVISWNLATDTIVIERATH